MGVNGKYRLLQSCYWMMINIGFGYTAFYLGEFGFGAGMIGVLTAVYGVVSAAVQPVLGRIADRSSRLGWKRLLLILACACTVSLAAMQLIQSGALDGAASLQNGCRRGLTAVLFGLVAVLINCMMPLINTACFYYQKRGEQVDFGIARGLGSLSYAAVSLLLGVLTVRLGTSAIPAAGIPVTAAMILIIWFLPYEAEKEKNTQKDGKKGLPQSDNRSMSGFVKKYPAFCVMTAGSALLLSVHNLNNTFLIQVLERVGGNSSHLGTALAIAAALEVPVLFLFTSIVKRVPESTLLVISGIGYLIKSVILMLAGSVGMIYAAQLTQPFAYALYASANVYFADRCMEEQDSATGQALMSMTSPIGTVLGNLLGGWLIDQRGVSFMLQCTSVLAIAAAAVIAFAVMIWRREAGRKKYQNV